MEASGTPAARGLAGVRRLGAAALAVLGIGLLGAVLLVVAEFSNLVTVDVRTTGTCEELAGPGAGEACSVSGFEQHGGALLLLGFVAAVMTVGAARGSSRPAAVALVAIAVIVLAFAILRDVPKTGETGLIGINYEAAMASAGPALFLEIAGAVALAIAGLATLLRRRDQTARSDA
jgi:hypothetical protein